VDLFNVAWSDGSVTTSKRRTDSPLRGSVLDGKYWDPRVD